ncbi:MAG TPA: tetratricopeptide repeat protein [Steroidobacteraceae bacterium]|nr:tetratricopeptide repeat protein [Steroidobacteraceae bacterium]
MRSALSIAFAILLLGSGATIQAASAARSPDRCATVAVSAPQKFHGKLLEEIPDIREPELRLANQLLSSGCFDQAFGTLTAYLERHPEDPHAMYVRARWNWIHEGSEMAALDLQELLAAHPEFASAKVLMAGTRFAADDYPGARQLLDQVPESSPEDLWLFLYRLKIKAAEHPSDAVRAQLLEILRNEAFPPNARESAAHSGIEMRGQRDDQLEEFLRLRLEVKSSVPSGCKFSMLAQHLSEKGGRYEQARELLESQAARESQCLREPFNRMLLAQAYLMAAARVAPAPTAANAELVGKARKLLEGQSLALRKYVRGKPQAATLRPFPNANTIAEPVDEQGRTELCRAVRARTLSEVSLLLQKGANPNGSCDHHTMIGQVIYDDTPDPQQQRFWTVTFLVGYGGEPTADEMDHCRQRKYGNCSEVLLPYLEEQM